MSTTQGAAMGGDPVVPTRPDIQWNVDIPAVENNHASRVAYIDKEKFNLKSLIPKFRQGKDLAPAAVERLQTFLMWLASGIEMTPQLKNKTNLDQALKLLILPAHNVTADYVAMANYLCGKWEAERWGETLVVDEDSDDEEEANDANAINITTPAVASTLAGSGSVSTSATRPSNLGPIAKPRNDHPIYGLNGIMHGVVWTRRGQKASYFTDTRYPPRGFKQFGHNGLTVGQWWPLQIVALVRGAHGSRMGGIAGDATEGAYSVVVSGTYSDLDQDYGNVIHYSGSRSHKNQDPNNAEPSRTNTALTRSIATGRPVRVLRSSKKGAHWAPQVGIRYDGLYSVVRKRNATNLLRGLYEQFELRRLPGQRPLEQFRLTSPTAREVVDYEKVRDGY